MEHFQIVERELKSRYNKALKEPIGSDFIMAVFEYVRVVELSPLLLQILNKQKIYSEYSKPRNINDTLWGYYSRLRADVYEPIKKNGHDLIAESFPHFMVIDNHREDIWYLFPKAWKAWYHHLRFTNRLKYIHPRLLTELANWKIQTTAPELHAINFDEQNSILYLDGIKVEINKQNRDNNGHLLLAHIFKQGDISQEFYYADFAPALFGSGAVYNNNPDPYRFACDSINKAVYSEMRKSKFSKKIPFLLFNNKKKGSCRINPVYLS